MTRILFLTNLSGKFNGFRSIRDVEEMDCSATGLGYPINLLKELSTYVDVDVCSPPLQTIHKTTPLDSSESKRFAVTFAPSDVYVPQITDVEALLAGKDYDVVLVYAESIFAYLKNLEKISAKKVLWFLSSPHQILLPIYKKFLEEKGADLVLKVADKRNVTEFGREFARLCKNEWLPLSVDGNRFKRLALPKIADVCLFGNINPLVYPFRVRAVNAVIRSAKYGMFVSPSYGENYVREINQSKLFLTCSGMWKFPVMKYYESMACGTALVADDPIDADELGFKPDENYVSVADAYTPKAENPSYPLLGDEWEFREDVLMGKLDYYLTHVGARDRIAEAGEELVRKRHTDEVRAKELYEMLVRL